jgi:hypothetical protein
MLSNFYQLQIPNDKSQENSNKVEIILKMVIAQNILLHSKLDF